MLSVISTVGTSIFSKADDAVKAAVAEFAKRQDIDLDTIVSKSSGFEGELLHQIVLASLEKKSSSVSMIREASAELNSLQGILSSRPLDDTNDQLHFLASATPNGALAARLIADFSMVYFDRPASIHIVPGLQVDNAEAFRRHGLRNLIKVVYEILDAANADSCKRIFNPTGGFKSVVPYLTIIGMLENVELHYIYENSPQLIQLAPMPISLDMETIARFKDVLERCADTLEGIVEDDLQKALGIANQPLSAHPLWPLFIPVDFGNEVRYSLSGLGEIVHQRLIAKQRVRVYLSRQAAERLDAEDQGSRTRTNWIRMLDNIHHPIWRKMPYRHEYKGCDFPAIKLKATGDRLFYKEFPDHILILELAKEKPNGAYDRVPLSLKPYDRFRVWEGDKKSPK